MVLSKDGIEVSRHRSEVEAMERASEEGPGTYVLKRPDATIVVEGAVSVPDPEPEPEPEPDPEPEPEPDPEPEPEPEPEPDPDPVPSGLEFIGGFRIRPGAFGNSRAAYGPGVFCVTEGGVWLAGHNHHFCVGKYGLPDPVKSQRVEDYPNAENTVPYFKIAPEDWSGNITGLYEISGRLHVNVAQYYDASGQNKNHAAIVETDGTQSGYYTVPGGAKAAGWMQPIPVEWQQALGGTHLMGYAANLPINSRMSIGPSLYVWDGKDPTTAEVKMVYPLSTPLGPTGGTDGAPADPLWNELSDAYCGFIVGDDYFVVGMSSGLESGIGYKINGAGGYTTYDPDEKEINYFWRYRLQDILDADKPWEPRPYEYGELDVFTGPVAMDGAFYNDGLLYLLSYSDRSQSRYEANPVIFVYRSRA